MAETDFEYISDYLFRHWGYSVTEQFLILTEKLTIQISKNPKQFPLVSPKKRVRKCVLTKHNTLFYREQHAHIEIVRIFDTRQDPDKLTLS